MFFNLAFFEDIHNKLLTLLIEHAETYLLFYIENALVTVESMTH
jgi:hypothetical protein